MGATLAELSSRLNLRERHKSGGEANKSFRRISLPSVILVTDFARLRDPVDAVKLLPRGSAVIFRHYEAPNREEVASTLSALCREKGVYLLIGGDACLALRVGADGVHFPEQFSGSGDMGTDLLLARKKRLLISVAAHSYVALVAAARIGADFALLSPVFPSKSHPGGQTLGPLRLAQMVNKSPLPVYALGGIDVTNFPLIEQSGVVGIAALEGLLP